MLILLLILLNKQRKHKILLNKQRKHTETPKTEKQRQKNTLIVCF